MEKKTKPISVKTRMALKKKTKCSSVRKNSSKLKNIQLVKHYATKVGFKLKNFKKNKSLELYFAIYRGNKNICYISKGWRDPGFRIGAFAEIHKGIADFKERLNYIEKICSRDFIGLEYQTKQGDGNVCISLEVAVYKSGFNEKVLKEVVEILEEDLKSIKLVSSGLISLLSQSSSY